MAGGGRYPNPDGERRNRAERQFDWTVLPFDGRQGPAPELPKWRQWTQATLEWWSQLWSTPQATMWDPSGRSLHALALLHHELMLDEIRDDGAPSRAPSITGEMRQHEDRHGLTPKAMLQLRWRVASSLSEGAKVLELVHDAPPRPDAADMPSKRALKGAWVEWAVSWGADRAAAEKLTKADLIREFSSVGAAVPSPALPGPRPTSKAAQRLRDRSRR